MPLAIEMAGVEKRFASCRALDRLDLSIPEGSVFGLLGPNGAGKTSTIRIVLGLLRADAGRVRVLGRDPIAEGQRVRDEVGVLLEHDGLYDRLSALANLDYHARIRELDARLGRVAKEARVESLLRSFDLWDRRADVVAGWSKGMRQKLAIARALLHRPKLLLLDEPFTGLDPAAAVDLRERLGEIVRDDEATILLTTHDLAHVERSCSHVAVLQAGKIVASGSPDELAHAGDLEVQIEGRGLDEAVLASMKEAGLVQSFRCEGASARVTCSKESRPRLGVELVARGVELAELHCLKGSLEEAFLSIVRAEMPTE